jgi:Tol biopolymer transport system component
MLFSALLALAVGAAWPAFGNAVQLSNSSDAFTWCESSCINADGSVVAFASTADLTGGNPDGSDELFVVNSDGTGLRQLTSDPTYDSLPNSMNAAGSVIALDSQADLTGGNPEHWYQIFVVNSDGTGLRQLTSGHSHSWLASMSADGSVIAFESEADLTGGNPDYSFEVFVINSDGTGLRQLTHCSDAAYRSEEPSISGDGSLVGFDSTADLTGGNADHSAEIFVIHSDGTGLRQLADCGDSWEGPSIDADGSVIAFSSTADLTGGNPDHSSEVFVINSDGTGLRQLTDDPVYASWSFKGSINAPGTVVAFGSQADLTGGNPDHLLMNQVFVMNADGTGLRQLTGDPLYPSVAPSISADGSMVVFESYADLTGGNPDHSDEMFLATTTGWLVVDADTDLPSSLSAGDTYDAMVTAKNDSTTIWNDTYSLNEVMGAAESASAIARWSVGQLFIADGVTVPTGDDPATEDVVENQYEFDFTVVAPPWVTLEYDIPVTATSVPVISSFEDNYIMADTAGVFMTEDTAAAGTTVQRPAFSDVPPGFWAWGEIQECANAASASSGAITHGYGDGSFQFAFEVTRAMMAVFLANAMGLTDDPPVDADGNPVPTFPVDVPPTYWSYTQIEQCVLNGVVKGYGDYYGPGIPAFLPGNSVNRDQMAVFLVRAADIPTVAYGGGFSDIANDTSDGWWARDEIQAASGAHIALGYLAGDGSTEFKPSRPVLRDQMAVFIWRALVMDGDPMGASGNGANVVVAGPAVTTFAEVDPGVENLAELFMPTDVAGLSYLGWTVPVNDDGDPILEGGSIVYVGLDAVHVASGDITFAVSHVETVDDEDVTVVDATSNVLTVDGAAARTEVNTPGTPPYLIASYVVPTIAAGVDDVDYTVRVTLPNGAALEIGTFTVTGTG